MKALKCEMCNSNNLVKQDGMYVCQSCGTKYTPEDAQKLMVEIDNSKDIENWYMLARRADDNNDSENAAKYYSLILEEEPNSWEAMLFSTYYRCSKGKMGDIYNNIIRFNNALSTITQLILTIPLGNDEQRIAALKFMLCVKKFYCFVMNNLVEYMNSTHSNEYPQKCSKALYDMFFDAAEIINIKFKDKENAKDFYETIAKGGKGLVDENTRAKAISRIKEIDPNYTPPVQKSGGCYVATCVYGSYDCPQVWTLRRYRDYTLAETWYGRAFIHTYYAISPTIVKLFGDTKWFKKLWRGKLDRVIKKLNENGVENTPYNDKIW